jgi:hypothetical protein
VQVAGGDHYGMRDLGGGAALQLDAPAAPHHPSTAQRRSGASVPGRTSQTRRRRSSESLRRPSADTLGGGQRLSPADPFAQPTGGPGSRTLSGDERLTPADPFGDAASAETLDGAPAPGDARASPAGVSAAEVDMPHGGGRVLDDPLAGPVEDGPALELAVENQRPTRKKKRPVKRKLTPEELRAKRITEIAGYGPAPVKLWEAIPYSVKVMLRKRELEAQLITLSAHRKRADDAAQDALVQLGHSLYELRFDPRLRALRTQFRAVTDSAGRIGKTEAAGAQKQQEMQAQVDALSAKLDEKEQVAAPVREKEAKLSRVHGEMKTRLERSQMALKKLDSELHAVQQGKLSVDAERFGAMQNEREEHHGTLQTLGVKLRPLEEQLSAARAELAKHQRVIDKLAGELRAHTSALTREATKQQVSAGTAQSAYRDALLSLGKTALGEDLSNTCAEQAQEAHVAAERAQKNRAEEEIVRAAYLSYDADMYKKGYTILLGGSGAMLLALLIAIFA